MLNPELPALGSLTLMKWSGTAVSAPRSCASGGVATRQRTPLPPFSRTYTPSRSDRSAKSEPDWAIEADASAVARAMMRIVHDLRMGASFQRPRWGSGEPGTRRPSNAVAKGGSLVHMRPDRGCGENTPGEL